MQNSFNLQFNIVLEQTVRCSWTVQFFVMFDMFEVRFWAKMWCSEVFKVHSCCYVTRLVLKLIVWCSLTVQFFVMFNMFKVRFWAKMWCSESSMFGHSMFGVFKVRYFGVHSKTTRDSELLWNDGWRNKSNFSIWHMRWFVLRRLWFCQFTFSCLCIRHISIDDPSINSLNFPSDMMMMVQLDSTML